MRAPANLHDVIVCADPGESKKLIFDPNLHLAFGVTLMAVLGVASVTPAFPKIVTQLGISESQVGLLVTVFTLPGVVLTPILGILADRWGRKRVLVPSLILFGVAGASCSLVHDFSTLLLLRAVQGVGAASLGALNVTILGDLYRGPRLMTAMGYNGTVLSVGTAAYPAVGGALAAVAWHWPFALPIVALPLALLVLVRLETRPAQRDVPVGRYLLELVNTLKHRRVVGVLVASLFTFVLLYGAILTYLPIFMAQRFEASPATIGLVLSCMSVTSKAMSAGLGRLSRTFGPRRLIGTGMVAYAVTLAAVPSMKSPVQLAALGLLYGAANGINIPTFIGLLSNSVSDAKRGAVMSINGMVLRLGQTLGPLVMAAIFVSFGIAAVYYAGVVVALVMWVLVMALLKGVE